MSICSCVIVVIILVEVVIDGGVSNCSTYRILLRRFSTLLLSACRMSSTSTGVGGAGSVVSVGVGYSGCDPLSRFFLRDAMCGSLVALFAEPRTNTNFASNSLGMVWRASSRVWSSPLGVSGVDLSFFIGCFSYFSRAFIYRSMFSSSVSIRYA